MPGNTKEIRTKIHNIQNTKKITSAMEMVAASKMRKSQDRMEKSRPYADKILKVIRNIARSSSEYKHKYLQQKEVKKEGYIIVSTDRGLCGGLNNNLFRKFLHTIESKNMENLSLYLFGGKSQSFFKNMGLNISCIETNIGDNVDYKKVVNVINVMLDDFNNNKVDKVSLVYNKFVNSMQQDPVILQLLPLEKLVDKKSSLKLWDYIYEPDSKSLMDSILSRYIEIEVFHAISENIACEQSARMVAMKSASDNAKDLIKSFQVMYNKARQAAITQEIAEIIGGSEAV